MKLKLERSKTKLAQNPAEAKKMNNSENERKFRNLDSIDSLIKSIRKLSFKMHAMLKVKLK